MGLPSQKLKAIHGMDIADMEVMVAGMDANVVKQTPMQLQSQKPMPGMAMDTIHTTGTTILAKEKLKLKLSHNHGMDIEDMEVIMVAGMDANAVKPKLTHGEDTVGVDMDMEDIMVKFVYHGTDIYE